MRDHHKVSFRHFSYESPHVTGCGAGFSQSFLIGVIGVANDRSEFFPGQSVV